MTVKKVDIDDRRATKSAMPDDLVGKLSRARIARSGRVLERVEGGVEEVI